MVPANAIASKAFIIPETVPRNPMSGATPATAARTSIPLSRNASSTEPAVVIASSRIVLRSAELLYFSNFSSAGANIFATGFGFWLQIATASSTPPFVYADLTCSTNNPGFTLALNNVKNLSKM